MRQQQTFRGFIFILLMLILIATAVRFPYARQADKVTIRIYQDTGGWPGGRREHPPESADSHGRSGTDPFGRSGEAALCFGC